MQKIDLALAVIAYDDIDSIRGTLDSIARQEMGDDINLSVILARHSAGITEAEVRELFADCKADLTVVQFEQNPDLNVMRCLALPVLASAVPDDADWVWTLEAGQNLSQRDSLKLLATSIRSQTHAGVHVIHVTDANRSFNTGYALQSTLEEFCSDYGYFEIVGKPALLIVRPAQYRFAFNDHLAETAEAAKQGNIWVSQHTHSQFMYLALSKSVALSLDLKLVDLEGNAEWSTPRQTHEWFRVAREIIELGSTVGEGAQWHPHFFRYGTASLWSELIRQQGICAEAFTPDMTDDSLEILHFIDQWQVILRLGEYVKNEEAREVIVDVVTIGIRLTLEFLENEGSDTSSMKSFFEEQTKDISTYPTTMVRADYLMKLLQRTA